MKDTDRRSPLALALYQLLASNRSGLFSVYLGLFLISRGATVAQALAIFSAAYVVASLTGPAAGRWSDRVGKRRPFLLFAEAASLPFFVVIPWIPSFWLDGAVFVVAETLLAVGSPALTASVADITRRGERGWGYGYHAASGAVGTMVGILIAGVVVGVFGLEALCYLVGVLMCGTIVLVAFLFQEGHIEPAPPRRPLKEMKGIAVFSFAASVRTLGTGAVAAFYAIYASALGASNFEVSLVAFAGFATSAAVSVPLGRRVDRIGEIRGLLFGTAIAAAGLLLFLVAGTWPELLPARVVYQIGFAFMSPAMLSWVVHQAPSGRRAEYLGFFSLINSTMWSCGPFLGGVVFSATDAAGVFVFAIVMTCVSLSLLYGLYARTLAERPAAEAAPEDTL